MNGLILIGIIALALFLWYAIETARLIKGNPHGTPGTPKGWIHWWIMFTEAPRIMERRIRNYLLPPKN